MRTILVTDKKTGKKKRVNVPDFRDTVIPNGGGAYNVAISSNDDGSVYSPIFYNTTTGRYYTINVRGTAGSEYLQVVYVQNLVASLFAIKNSTNSALYTVKITGGLGSEVPTISTTTLTNYETVKLYNPDVDAYYYLYITGTTGNEVLSIASVSSVYPGSR